MYSSVECYSLKCTFVHEDFYLTSRNGHTITLLRVAQLTFFPFLRCFLSMRIDTNPTHPSSAPRFLREGGGQVTNDAIPIAACTRCTQSDTIAIVTSCGWPRCCCCGRLPLRGASPKEPSPGCNHNQSTTLAIQCGRRRERWCRTSSRMGCTTPRWGCLVKRTAKYTRGMHRSRSSTLGRRAVALWQCRCASLGYPATSCTWHPQTAMQTHL